MEKHGFHRCAWLVILLLGGLLMIFGAVQDMMLFFSPGQAAVQPWYTALPEGGLAGGLVVLASALLNVAWGYQLRHAEGVHERNLARGVALVSIIAMIADWISGYYGFGSLVAFLVGIWLMRKQ